MSNSNFAAVLTNATIVRKIKNIVLSLKQQQQQQVYANAAHKLQS